MLVAMEGGQEAPCCRTAAGSVSAAPTQHSTVKTDVSSTCFALILPQSMHT